VKVLVCGGRDYVDQAALNDVLDSLDLQAPITQVIHGGARGADHMAGVWASGAGVWVRIFRADWGTHGKAAGPIRNQRMLDEGKPDLVVACSGGTGTADMVRRAQEAGHKVLFVAGHGGAE
jgi:hypothetical protein